MAMARRELGAARVGLRAMMSLEPWTIPGCGYPNLLATGEFCDGDTIHDRQHPHDLFMELAAEYDRPLFGTVRWEAYGRAGGRTGARASGIPPSHLRAPEPPFADRVITGSTRRTSPTACSRPASTARDGRWRVGVQWARAR